MTSRVITIDQSTSATKAMLFSETCELLHRVNINHEQYYPQEGWVEHDADEIYENTLQAISSVLKYNIEEENISYSLAITNQRETVVVWDRHTGVPVHNAIVWQCQRGVPICENLKERGYSDLVQRKSGLLIDPYFSASGVNWILDNVVGARSKAERGDLLMGTIDSWLIWKLTHGDVHATDYTNASRTLLFNIHTLDWDEELLSIFTIPRNMMPKALPCDSVFGNTTAEGLFKDSVEIAGVLGDSHGALVGQMCFETGMGKATYGTGSSIMVNIGKEAASAPEGLVTSVGFALLEEVYYAFEGNIHCTGATIKWLNEKLELIDSVDQIESEATSVKDTGGVYLVPAFAGLGAPWWKPDARAAIVGITLNTGKKQILRAGVESIAYQVKDLVDLMIKQAGVSLKQLRVDGGPTKNKFLMQFQADMLETAINISDIEEASALGAVIMNGFARNKWQRTDQIPLMNKSSNCITPKMPKEKIKTLYEGWCKAVKKVILQD